MSQDLEIYLQMQYKKKQLAALYSLRDLLFQSLPWCFHTFAQWHASLALSFEIPAH